MKPLAGRHRDVLAQEAGGADDARPGGAREIVDQALGGRERIERSRAPDRRARLARVRRAGSWPTPGRSPRWRARSPDRRPSRDRRRARRSRRARCRGRRACRRATRELPARAVLGPAQAGHCFVDDRERPDRAGSRPSRDVSRARAPARARGDRSRGSPAARGPGPWRAATASRSSATAAGRRARRECRWSRSAREASVIDASSATRDRRRARCRRRRGRCAGPRGSRARAGRRSRSRSLAGSTIAPSAALEQEAVVERDLAGAGREPEVRRRGLDRPTCPARRPRPALPAARRRRGRASRPTTWPRSTSVTGAAGSPSSSNWNPPYAPARRGIVDERQRGRGDRRADREALRDLGTAQRAARQQRAHGRVDRRSRRRTARARSGARRRRTRPASSASRRRLARVLDLIVGEVLIVEAAGPRRVRPR